MSKTTFINGNPSQGIQGTRVTAEFLNAVNAHRHTGLDEDGHGALDYAVAAGYNDAYAITLPLPLSAHVEGMPIAFKANFSNTGAASLNVNNLGAVTITALNQPLSAGMILEGSVVHVVFDGTNYQLQSPFGNMVTQADINADSITGNATTEHHGFLPKLSGDDSQALLGTGCYGKPNAVFAEYLGSSILSTLGEQRELILNMGSVYTGDIYLVFSQGWVYQTSWPIIMSTAKYSGDASIYLSATTTHLALISNVAQGTQCILMRIVSGGSLVMTNALSEGGTQYGNRLSVIRIAKS